MTEDFDVLASRATEPAFYHAPHPDTEDSQPRPYQHAGVEYQVQRRSGIIGDAPGVGKTKQAIMLSNAIGAKHTLVIPPASLVLNWEREIWKASTIENVYTYPVLRGKRGVDLNANYVVMSYDMLRNDGLFSALMSTHWDHLILDEAHYLKDPKGNKRTKAVTGWVERIKGQGEIIHNGLIDCSERVTLLTGTLMPNQPRECLAAETLCLTDNGWKPIVMLSTSDRLWDGEAWVRHEGVVDKGLRETISMAGVQLTPDHLVWQGRWVKAQSVKLSKALASVNLPSCLLPEDRLVALSTLSQDAIAVQSLPRIQAMLSGAVLANAEVAARKRVPPSNTEPMNWCARIKRFVRGFLSAYRTLSCAATTRGTLPSGLMEGEEYLFTRLGAGRGKDACLSWHTFSLCRDTITRRLILIAKTIAKATSRAILDLFLAARTQRTEELSTPCKRKSMTLRSVYDIVNAGPRQRFTILTDAGPLIVHNCYNAIRMTDHAAINYASLDEFVENYYDLGGGLITDRFGGVKWSNKVRNIPKNLDDLQFRLRKYVMVRRLKAQVLPQLPPTEWHLFPIELDAGIRSALKSEALAEVQAFYQMDPNIFAGDIPIDGAVSTARRELGEAKAPAVARYIADMFEGGTDKLVVAAWHTDVLAYLKKELEKYGFAYMDGSTPVRQRQAQVDRFQNDPNCHGILGQKQVLCLGWTLTAAQDVVDAEPDWVPGNNTQLLDRINRFGQLGDYTLCHMPVVPGTLDERIISDVVRKDKAIYAALDA